MARRKRKSARSPNRRGKQDRTQAKQPAPLLVIDQKPILKKALAQCRRLRTELNKKQARLRAFEEEEMPAYERWFSSEFGAQLTELRELHQSLHDHEFVADQLGWCEMCRPEKLSEVFTELMQRMKDGTLHAFEPPPPEHPEEEEDDEEEDDFPGDEDEDFFDAAFRAFFGFSDADEGHEGDGRREQAPLHSPEQRQSPEAGAIKALYRTLAKRLHPDHSDLEEALRERRWNELQQAYQEHDLEALQRIEAVCDMEADGGLSIRLGLARLRDLAAYHRSHVLPIREALRQAKRHPAFDFVKAEKSRLREESNWDIRAQRRECLERLAGLREIFDAFAEDITEDAAAQDPEIEPEAEEEDTDDFWDSYTAWRDEELAREGKG
ncbi:MAG: J domain-containing protein [Opitutales bacterium]